MECVCVSVCLGGWLHECIYECGNDILCTYICAKITIKSAPEIAELMVREKGNNTNNK